jgi:putative membrane protein
VIRTDDAFVEGVERAVREAERGTSAELVVVVAARSGSYRDIAIAAGGVAGLAVFLVALFAPRMFPAAAVAFEVPAAGALAAWLVHRAPGLLRRLVSSARAERQVERAASWWFLEEAVHGTRARTGVLVYVSLLEERVAVIPDFGLTAAVPEAMLRAVRWRADGSAGGPRRSDDVLRGIAAIGALLRERLPGERADANELPDRPRIVS